MTPSRVVLSGPARRDFGRLDRQVAARIQQALVRLAEDGQGDIKRLTARGDELRLRVGEWRVTFRRDQTTRIIDVIRVLPRGRAYQR